MRMKKRMFIVQAQQISRVAILISGVASFITGCSLFSGGYYADPKQATIQTLPTVNISEPEAFTERLKPHGWDIGSFLDPWERGALFTPTQRSHVTSALVYFYRPDSAWSRAEIIPASLFINGLRIPSLKNNHYYAVELPAGEYRLAIRRPLPPVYFQKGTVVDFQVQAGKTYYLRYAEQYHVPAPDPALGLLYARPIAQMPEKAALQDLRSMRLKTPNLRFIHNPDKVDERTFTTTGVVATFKPVDKDRLSEKQPVYVAPQFSFTNPLTW